MNAAHIHLMVVHLPVVLCPLVLVLLAWGQLRHNDVYLRQGYTILILCAAAGVVAFYSGPSAFELLQEKLVAERDLVEDHAAIARAAFIVTLVGGVLALQALLQFAQEEPPARWLRTTILMTTLLACYLMAWSAHLGGQIRHPEVRGSQFFFFPNI